MKARSYTIARILITPIYLWTGAYIGPEDETATGPSYVRQYQITVDIADGQTISNLDVIDSLPNNIIVSSIDSVTVGGAAAAYSDNLWSLTQPGNNQDLTVTLTNPVVGGTTSSDVVVTISFYVPELGADGSRIIPINGEDDTTSTPDSRSHNSVSAVGDWTAIDIRDGSGTDNAVADPAGVEHTLDNKSIAIQKSVAVVGGGEALPGSVLEYTLNFQISDYYTFGDLVIDDIFQDGQLFDFSFGATFDITDINGNVTGSFTVRQIGDADGGQTLVVDQTQIDRTDDAGLDTIPGNIDDEDGAAADGSDGTTTLRFDLSKALTDNGAADGILQGGLSDGATNQGDAGGTIRFRTVIQEEYADSFPSNDRSVDQGDSITNNDLSITGSVRQNEEDGSIATTLLAAESDNSSASITIATGTLVKEVYAINGNTTLPMGTNGLPVIVAGDVVTYRVRYDLPTSDVEDFTITDFLPLPIFEVNDHNADGTPGDAWTLDVSNQTLDGNSGTIEIGANDDFYAEYFASTSTNPTITIDAANNELAVNFGDYDDPSSTPNVLELYINITAQDALTADGLFLTNIVRAEEGNTQQGVNSADAIIQIEVTQPVLNITKGWVDSGEFINQSHQLSASSSFTGTYTITVGGETTTAIASTANAATIRAAIAALGSINSGDVTVTGGPLIVGGAPGDDPVVIQFGGSLEGDSVGAISVSRGEIASEELSSAVKFNGVDPDLTDNTNNDIDQIPEIGVAKRLVSSTSGSSGGNWNLTYELVVRNLGSTNLTDLSLLEDLDGQFGIAFQGVVTAPTITASTALTDPIFASGGSTWDGDTNTDMFDGISGLIRPGDEFTIRFTVEVDIDQLSAGSNNQVSAEGDFDVPDPDIVAPNSTGTVDDLSDTGTDPLGTNPGVPGDSGGSDDPTLVPAIGIAKDHGDYTELTDANGNPIGHFVFQTILVIENLGATDLTNLNLLDDIASIYGDAFVSVDNLVVTPTVAAGTAPTANLGWLTDTTANMLASGSLDPGDTFTVTFDVTLNPDAGGGSGYFNNQATIVGSDPTNPSAVVQDFSDSGLDPSTTNTGEPGDFGTADDPTPVAIPDIGLAKRVTNVVQKGLTFELTIDMVLANTGTVDLENIALSDDMADQYGANFGRVIGNPVIIASTATTDPTINTGYQSDTTQAIFDGTDGFLRPGESITIRLVVEVVPENGQTEVTVVNQATTSADPLDENGSPLEDNSGNPIGRISDLCDSGADSTGQNPGAPGDTGHWDDPTPQPLTFFTFDAFNDFSQGKKGLQQPDKRDSSDPFDDSVGVNPDWYGGRNILTHQITSLAPEPIFSGSARPGTQVFGRVFDSAGRLIGEELSMADVGGNWTTTMRRWNPGRSTTNRTNSRRCIDQRSSSRCLANTKKQLVR